jgi:hypothetical protein
VTGVERAGGLPLVPGMAVSPTGGESVQPGQQAPGERSTFEQQIATLMPQGYEQPSQPPSIDQQVQLLGLGGYEQAPSGVPGEVQQLTPEQIAAGINIPPSAGIAPPPEVERGPLDELVAAPPMTGGEAVPYPEIGRLPSGGYDPNLGVFNYPGGAHVAGVTTGEFPPAAPPTEGERPETEKEKAPEEAPEEKPEEKPQTPPPEEMPPSEKPAAERIPLPPSDPRAAVNQLKGFEILKNNIIQGARKDGYDQQFRTVLNNLTTQQKIDLVTGRLPLETIARQAVGDFKITMGKAAGLVDFSQRQADLNHAYQQAVQAHQAYQTAQREYMGPPSPGVDYPTEEAPRPPEDIPQVVTPSPSSEIPLPQPRPPEAPSAPPWDITNIPPPPADVTQLPPPWEITTPVPWTLTAPLDMRPPNAPGGIYELPPFGPGTLPPEYDTIPYPAAPPAAAPPAAAPPPATPSPEAPRGPSTAPSERTPSAPSTGGVDAGQGTGTAGGAGYIGGVGEYPAPIDLSYFGGGVPGPAMQMAQTGAQMLSSVAQAKSRYPNEIAQIAAAYGVDIDTAATIFLAQHGQIASRQYGGPLYAGQPSLVGEQGPEMFVPNQPGTVVPLPRPDPRRDLSGLRGMMEGVDNYINWGQANGPASSLPGSLAPMLPVPSDQQIRQWIVPGARPPPSPPPPGQESELSTAPDVEEYRSWARQQIPPAMRDLEAQGYRFNPENFQKWLKAQRKSQRIEDRRLYDPTTAGMRDEGA